MNEKPAPEPPATDEPRTRSKFERLKRDQDLRLAAGCVLFTLSALAQGVATIAIAALRDPKTNTELAIVIMQVFVVGLIVGAIAVLIEPVAGFFGSVAGQLCGGVFMFIRFRENALGFTGVKGLEPAEYDVWTASIVPIIVWIGMATALASVAWIRSVVLRRMRRDRARQGP